MSSTEESIEVMHRPSVQSSELADLRKALMAFSPNVDFREHDPGPQANVDWALPAALAIYVSAPLVRSFLSTLGSEAAEATIGAFSSAHRRINGRSKWLQAGGRVRRGPVISVALADAC